MIAVTEFAFLEIVVAKLNRQSFGSTVSHVARVILGATVLFAILWGNLPSSVVATGPLCTLSCCVGRAPHPAGSCMNGSCHANLIAHRKATHVPDLSQPTEQLCGLPRLAAPLYRLGKTPGLGVRLNADYKSETSNSSGASITTRTLGKPCASDCGVGTLSSTNQRRPRETAALSFADRHRPLTSSRMVAGENANLHTRDPRYRLANPRAPPTLIS